MRLSGVALALLLASSCAPSTARPPLADVVARGKIDQAIAGAASPVATPASPASPALGIAVEEATRDQTSDAPETPSETLADANEQGEAMPDEATQGSEPDREDPTALSDEELVRRVEEDLASLPSISVGKPNAGALLNAVRMPEGPHWELIDPERAYATQETVDYLVTAIEEVEEQHGHLHPVWLGHFSDHDGGRLRPHRSHQSGRDVDLSYYYLPEKAEWYRPAVAGTLDVARTWTFVRALITKTDVELILIDRRVQKMLKEHALSIGEDREWLDQVFEYRSRARKPIIKHTWGHRTHIHVRFYNPEAQELGHRAYGALADAKLIRPRFYTVAYRARAGDNVASLAAKAGTSPEAFAKMNGSDRVQVGRIYAVPMRGEVAQTRSLEIPPRRRPPLPSGARRRGIVAGEM